MKEGSPKQQLENKGWLSGLISGAGKLLTSVFLTDDDYYSSSYYSDSCSDFEFETDLDECGDASHRDGSVSNQPSTESENVITERRSLDLPSKTKLSTEKLLQEESYSRDESFIQSRVVRPPMTENSKEEIDANFPNRNNDEGTASPRNNYSLGGNPCSPGYVNTFHTKSSADQTCTSHTTSMAVMEVKKWVDEKRLSSSSKSSPSYGPCFQNTDILYNESIIDGGLPVDEAKSYMQDLLKWRSPITTSFGIPSTVGCKRIHIKDDSKDTVEETRSVRQRKEEMSSSRFCRTYVRSKKGVEPGSFLNSLEASNRMGQVGSAIETVFDDRTHDILSTSDSIANITNFPVSNNGMTTDGDDILTFSDNAVSMVKETKNVQKIKCKRTAKGSLVESASNTQDIMGCTSLRSSSSTEDDQNEISLQVMAGSTRNDKQHCNVTMRSIKHMIKVQHPLNSDNGQERGRKTLSRSRRGRVKL